MHITKTVPGIAAIVAAVLVAGCGVSPDASATVSDSAGVRVVRVDWDEAPVGAIDSVPKFVVGAQTGDANLEFHSVRGIAVLNDSVLLVIDGGAQEIARIDMRARPSAIRR